jgi:hypothetical protein
MGGVSASHHAIFDTGRVRFCAGCQNAEAKRLHASAVDQGGEILDDPGHLFGLSAQFLRRCGAFLSSGGVRLSHRIQIGDDGVDLVDPLGLFFACRRDFPHQISRLGYPPHDFVENLGDFFGKSDAVVSALDGFVDHLIGVLGGLGRSHGQVPYFFCHNGESLTRLPGPRRFHRGIEGQQVGLEGDLVDDFDDLGGFVGRFPDLHSCGPSKRCRYWR